MILSIALTCFVCIVGEQIYEYKFLRKVKNNKNNKPLGMLYREHILTASQQWWYYKERK